MMNMDTILAEAEALTAGDRQSTYGDPRENWERTAELWSIILSTEVSPEQAILCMLAVKVARLAHKMDRDSAVDVCGYARLLERIGAL